MIRENRFLLSRKQYAADLTSLTIEESQNEGYCWGHIDAVWYRRRRGVTVACIGELRDLQGSVPMDAVEFLERSTDGRYGGDCWGRWDGENYWGAQRPDEIAAHLELLRPMLANYPQVPDGYSAWWTFQPPRQEA